MIHFIDLVTQEHLNDVNCSLEIALNHIPNKEEIVINPVFTDYEIHLTEQNYIDFINNFTNSF